MAEEKIEYIRGVRGRGEDLLKFFENQGVNLQGVDKDLFEKMEYIFFRHLFGIAWTPIGTKLGRLIVDNGEEMFLEPVYKFKVGDKVQLPDTIYHNFTYTISELRSHRGEPLYKLEPGGSVWGEDKMELYTEPLFKTGDKVYISDVGHADYGKVDHIGNVTRTNGEYSYSLQTTVGLYKEQHLKPYPGKFNIGDKVMVTQGLSKGMVFFIKKQEMLLTEPFYQVDSEDGQTRCGFAESALERYIEYKFKVGDKVLYTGQVRTIIGYATLNGSPAYSLQTDSVQQIVNENSLTPYEEPQVKTWDDLVGKTIEGYYINDDSKILPIGGHCDSEARNVAASERTCKSMLAMAQISQLMDSYGGEITDEEWAENAKEKFVIYRGKNEVRTNINYWNYEFLAFHTKEQRDEFLANNRQLVEDYLMISHDEDTTSN